MFYSCHLWHINFQRHLQFSTVTIILRWEKGYCHLKLSKFFQHLKRNSSYAWCMEITRDFLDYQTFIYFLFHFCSLKNTYSAVDVLHVSEFWVFHSVWANISLKMFPNLICKFEQFQYYQRMVYEMYVYSNNLWI